MAKYIDVESLVVGYSGHTPDDEFSKGVDFVLDLLDSKPPADVRPVVRGRWIPFTSEAAGDIWYCSACEIGFSHHMDFCPHCGADMRGYECE